MEVARRVTAVHVLLLVGCAVAIYLACEWFVNAVEWLGVELGVGDAGRRDRAGRDRHRAPGERRHPGRGPFGAASSARPSASAPRWAVRWCCPPSRTPSSARSCSCAGAARRTGARTRRRSVRRGRPPRLALDQTWFLVIAGAALVLGLVAFPGKPWLGLLFFVGVRRSTSRRELSGDGPAHRADDLEPLRLWRRDGDPPRWAVIAQTLVALVVVVVASQLFVRQLEWAGPELGLPPAAVALLLAPIATELPEVLNAVIWARQGKTRLAMANIAGSMMVQATVPAGIGLLFTPWHFDAVLLTASLATLAAVDVPPGPGGADRLRPGWVTGTAAFYGAFAAALAVELS